MRVTEPGGSKGAKERKPAPPALCPHCSKPAQVDDEGPTIWYLCCNTSVPKSSGANIREPVVISCGDAESRLPTYLAEMEEWQDTRLMRFLDWLEAHTPGGRWPWGMIWLGKGPLRGCSFHFASGSSGFAFGFPLPRWLPGFVRPYQVNGPRRLWRGERCPWWRESDLHVIVPLLPPGLPSGSRTRRLRGRKR